MSLKKIFGKTIGSALLGALFMAGGAIPARADRDDHDGRCERNVRKAEHNLEKAVRKHGERSRQAEQRRHQLEEARERCHMNDHDRDHDHR